MMEKEQKPQPDDRSKKTPLTSLVVSGVGAFSVLVLLFPSIIPDIIPIIGALDEAVATGLLISCLAYFGVDIGAVFGRSKKKRAESDVIDAELNEHE
jgi:uncharacterized membrane protein YkvA (DUF1232 family)